jgi:hypothetical protein
MSNDFSQNITKVFATESLPRITENLVMAGKDNNVTKTYEATWSGSNLNIGDEISIEVPYYVDNVDEFVTTTQTSYQKAQNVKLKVEKHLYKRLELNTKDATFNQKNFFNNMILPVMDAFGVAIEKIIFNKMLIGTYNYVELAGAPSSLADLTKILTKFNKLKVKQGSRRVVLTTTANEKVLNIDSIIKANERANAETVSTGYVGNHLGIQYYFSNILDDLEVASSTFSGGALKGALVKNQENLVVTLDGAVEGETVKAGSIIKLGNASIVAKADAVVDASGEIQISVEKVGFDVANDTVAELATVGKNFGFSPESIALATIAPAVPSGQVDSSIATDEVTKSSIRVTQAFDIDTLKNYIVFDLYVAAKNIMPELNFRF